MQQLIERSRIDARDGVLTRDQALIGEFDGDAQRGFRRALAVARLQHPQLALLDGELEVLHVAVVLFQQRIDARQLLERIRHRRFHRRLVGAGFLPRGFGDFLRRADAGDHVLALRVDQEFAVELLHAGGRVACEGDTGRRRVAHVAEHHRLHVDGGAPGFRNVVQRAIGYRARIHPRAEHGADRAPQLGVRVLRKFLAGLLEHGVLVLADDRHPILGFEVGVERVALGVLVGVEDLLEMMMLEADHHVRIHGDEAAVAVIGETLVAGELCQSLHRLIVEAEVEHGIHHAGHRGTRTGTHRHQQRIARVAERLAGQLADIVERLFDLRLQLGSDRSCRCRRNNCRPMSEW